jgi:Flp pilus assembly protein TadG
VQIHPPEQTHITRSQETMKTKSICRALRRQEGQTMAETAIVLPVLLVVLLGIIQFGILFNNYVTLTDAVRSGARKAAVARRTDPVAEGERQVRRSARDLDQGQLNVTVEAPNRTAGADVSVSATYPYSINLLGFVVASGRLSSKTTERLE